MFFTSTIVMGPSPNFPALLVWMRAMTAALSRLADLDGDGRLEMILKNRSGPQIRVFHNVMKEIGGSVAFRLRGTKSNRDAIGASVSVQAGTLRQTKYVQAGSGFLSQHTKEVFFGVGETKGNYAGHDSLAQWVNAGVRKFAGESSD